jgi:hypothetical protein
MTDKELLALKERIINAKVKASERKGQRDLLMKQLHDDWGVQTIAGAKNVLKTLNKEIADLTEKIERGLTKLERLDIEEG